MNLQLSLWNYSIFNDAQHLPGSPGLLLHFNDTPALLFQGNLGIVIQQPDIEINDTDPNVIRNLYDKLMHGGKVNKVLAEMPQYLLYGSLIDLYGICWHLRCER